MSDKSHLVAFQKATCQFGSALLAPKPTDYGLLADFLKNPEYSDSLTHLDLKEANKAFGDTELVVILSALRHCSNIVKLNIGSNAITPTGFREIANFLKTNTTLTCLNVVANVSRSDGCLEIHKTLSQPEYSNLNKLHFGHNNICDDGCRILANMLATNTSITHISLNNNNITHKSAPHLASMLRKNSTLYSMRIRNNQFGCEGVATLLDGLNHHPMIGAIDLSFTFLSNDSKTNMPDLIAALKRNTTIMVLSLRENQLTPQEGFDIIGLTAENPTLTQLDFGRSISRYSNESLDMSGVTKAFAEGSLQNLRITGYYFLETKICEAMNSGLVYNSTLKKLELTADHRSEMQLNFAGLLTPSLEQLLLTGLSPKPGDMMENFQKRLLNHTSLQVLELTELNFDVDADADVVYTSIITTLRDNTTLTKLAICSRNSYDRPTTTFDDLLKSMLIENTTLTEISIDLLESSTNVLEVAKFNHTLRSVRLVCFDPMMEGEETTKKIMDCVEFNPTLTHLTLSEHIPEPVVRHLESNKKRSVCLVDLFAKRKIGPVSRNRFRM